MMYEEAPANGRLLFFVLETGICAGLRAVSRETWSRGSNRRSRKIIYSVVNQKGGVGKTTTAINVSAYLALAGARVLLVDLDPQGNATSGLGIDRTSMAASTYDILMNDVPAQEAVKNTEIEGFSILPSSIDLAGAEPELVSRISRETVLKRAIAPLRDKYDWILIDAPPSLGLLTINALTAADSALIPVQCEYYALEGVSQLLQTIDLVRKHLNPTLEIGPVVMTMYDNRVRSGQQVVAEVRRAFGDKVAKTVVPRNVRLAEAPSHGMPISAYDPRSRGAIAYRDIAQEIMTIGKKRAG
jgi:chromosome partitioning protein